MSGGRSVAVRDRAGTVLGHYEVRADGMTCVWTVRRTSGYAANVADAITMVRRVAAMLTRREEISA